jgi:hypothetical protein
VGESPGGTVLSAVTGGRNIGAQRRGSILTVRRVVRFKESTMHGTDYKYPMSVTKALKLAGLIDVSHSSQEAMDRGTAIHAACEYYDQDDLEVTGMPEFIKPYLDAWVKFRKESEFRITGVEVKVDNEVHRYSGRIDRIVENRYGINGVLDIKSGQPASWHALQSAAYSQGVLGMLRFTLYINKDGGYKLVEHTDRSDWPNFLAALSVARLKVAWGINQE